ncbi:AAA family ATPase [Methylophilaceae bacterium]|nr:AAA family ATPase [Methylophilaceae bacterium]
MELFEIYSHLSQKYKVEAVFIQGSESTFYGYGKIMGQLNEELNLLQPISDVNKSLKISSRAIDKIEDHLKDFNHSYLILKLHESDLDSSLNKKEYIVESGSNKNAFDEKFDNKNSNGNYPKRRKTTLEIIQEEGNDEIKLNEEQTKVLHDIDEWVKGENPIAVLTGRAGTGKTTLLKSVVALLKKRKKTFSLLAPTGRAARVLKAKTQQAAITIHQEIYVFDKDDMQLSDDSENQQLKFEESDFSLNFKLKAEENISQIYIIDESSMIGNRKQADGELNFGSGKLMTDLLTQTGVINRKNVDSKILFVGDKIQLPPIREIESLGLIPDTLFKEFNLPFVPKYFELKKVMRQSGNSLILKNAEKLRSSVENKSFIMPTIETDNKTVLRTRPDKIKNKVLKDLDFKKHIMVTRSNAAAYSYNKTFREKIYGENHQGLVPNDLIMATRNTLEGNVTNGDIFQVIKIVSSETKRVTLNKSAEFKNKPKHIDLNFKRIIVRLIEHDDDKNNIEIFVIENLLNKPEIFLDKDEIIASRIDWNNRIREKNYSIEEKKDSYLTDKYINAVPIKFAYAITCHKAQGGEWDNVSIHLPMYNSEDEEYFRWLYTAITRSTKVLSFINLPE